MFILAFPTAMIFLFIFRQLINLDKFLPMYTDSVIFLSHVNVFDISPNKRSYLSINYNMIKRYSRVTFDHQFQPERDLALFYIWIGSLNVISVDYCFDVIHKCFLKVYFVFIFLFMKTCDSYQYIHMYSFFFSQTI